MRRVILFTLYNDSGESDGFVILQNLVIMVSITNLLILVYMVILVDLKFW